MGITPYLPFFLMDDCEHADAAVVPPQRNPPKREAVLAGVDVNATVEDMTAVTRPAAGAAAAAAAAAAGWEQWRFLCLHCHY